MNQLSDHSITRKRIFSNAETEFDSIALDMFHFQFRENAFYHDYCSAIKVKPESVTSIEKIPFLPIQFFKSRDIVTTSFSPEIIFESSGTTTSTNSRHLIKDLGIYEESFEKTFAAFYGPVSNFCIIGLLPSYLERMNSSLVWMVNDLVNKSGHAESGFYLYDHGRLREQLEENERTGQQTLLIGVTYALLDFFEANPLPLKHTIIMETGGMKGRRVELPRESVHNFIRERTGVAAVHAEYGMTELLSQAYAKNDGLFRCPPWMKVILRAEDDPFEIKLPNQIVGTSQNGVINVIDLANIFSCAFIATDDVGKLYNDGSFEVLGRLDNSDIRGCSLMVL